MNHTGLAYKALKMCGWKLFSTKFLSLSWFTFAIHRGLRVEFIDAKVLTVENTPLDTQTHTENIRDKMFRPYTCVPVFVRHSTASALIAAGE